MQSRPAIGFLGCPSQGPDMGTGLYQKNSRSGGKAMKSAPRRARMMAAARKGRKVKGEKDARNAIAANVKRLPLPSAILPAVILLLLRPLLPTCLANSIMGYLHLWHMSRRAYAKETYLHLPEDPLGRGGTGRVRPPQPV